MSSFVVSALKYRPQTFQSVVGQDALTTTLRSAIKSEKLAHAYLFCGPRGVGKTTCARIFAKTINCDHRTVDGEACNECESCVSFNEQRSYSIHELDAASNNGVDDIRTLTDQVRIPPQIGRYSVYIIDEVHMLSQGAFNAFLKTLEEPPKHAIFILATTEKHKIIPTILSRCQIYDFNRISTIDTVNHLKHVAKNEGVSIEESALNVIAQKSDGGMRDALSIFDQLVSFSGTNITYKSTIENLNVLDYEYYFQLVYAFLEGNISQSLLIFNEILNKGFDAHHFITGLSSHLRDVLVCKDPITIPLLEVGADISDRYKKQAEICPAEFIFAALKISNECDLNYRLSKNKRLLVELALIRICSLMDNKKKVLTENDKTLLQKLTPCTEAGKQEIIKQNSPTSTQINPKEEVKTEEKPEAQPISSTPLTVNTKNAIDHSSSKFNKPVSISISSFKKEETKIEETPIEVLDTSNKSEDNAISENDLLKHWNSYIDNIANDPGTAAFLKTHPPKLLEDNVIMVTVDNKFQEKELIQMDVMIYLRKELKNSSLKLKVEFTPEVELKKKLYSPQEIYFNMVKENPMLEKLKNNLSMEID